MSTRPAPPMLVSLMIFHPRHSVFPTKSYLKKFPGRQLNRWINTHYADQIIAVSPAAVDNLTEGGIPRERVTVLMNGVEPVVRQGEEGLAPQPGVTAVIADHRRNPHAEALQQGKTGGLGPPGGVELNVQQAQDRGHIGDKAQVRAYRRGSCGRDPGPDRGL